MHEAISLRRLWLLVSGDLVGNWGRVVLISGTAAGIVFLASLIAGSSSYPDSSFHQRWFVILLFGFGMPATIQALRPFHDRTLKEAFLLLPASTLEKSLARLLGTSVVLPALLLTFSALASLVIESLNLFVFFGHRRPFFDPSGPVVWTWIALYIVVQSPYFAGAAWFRRWPGLKTTLVIVVLLLALTVVATVSEIALRGASDGPGGGKEIFRALRAYLELNTGIVYAVLALIPSALWYLAWLRLRKVQADDAV